MANGQAVFKNIRLKTSDQTVTPKALCVCLIMRGPRQEKFQATANRQKTFQDETTMAISLEDKVLAEKGYIRDQDPETISCHYCEVQGKRSTGEMLHGENCTCAFNEVRKPMSCGMRQHALCTQCSDGVVTVLLSCGHVVCKRCCENLLYTGICTVDGCQMSRLEWVKPRMLM